MSAFAGKVSEDGTFSVLARITSLDGTGLEVVAGEGNVLTQADIASITCKVFDLGTNRNNTSGTEVTPAPSLAVATNVFDTLRTTGWGQDSYGYNFRHDVSASYVPDGGEWVLLEYKITLTAGGVAWLKVKVYAEAVQTS